jgi:hypothetical protein
VIEEVAFSFYVLVNGRSEQVGTEVLPGQPLGRRWEWQHALVYLRGDQARSMVTWKLSSWCSISSIVVSNRPMRTMPFQ